MSDGSELGTWCGQAFPLWYGPHAFVDHLGLALPFFFTLGSFDLVPDRDGTDERKKDGSGGFSEKEDWEVATEEDEARHVRSSRDRVRGLAVTTGPPGRGDMNEGAPDYLR